MSRCSLARSSDRLANEQVSQIDVGGIVVGTELDGLFQLLISQVPFLQFNVGLGELIMTLRETRVYLHRVGEWMTASRYFATLK